MDVVHQRRMHPAGPGRSEGGDRHRHGGVAELPHARLRAQGMPLGGSGALPSMLFAAGWGE